MGLPETGVPVSFAADIMKWRANGENSDNRNIHRKIE